MRSWFVLLAFAFSSVAPLFAQENGGPAPVPASTGVAPASVPDLRVVRDLPYVTGEAAHPTKHRLDLYLPVSVESGPAASGQGEAGTKPPLVMFVHGGAWQMGDRRPYGTLGRAFAKRGIACAAISYRLSPEVVHPAHVQDCASAFRWLVDHAAEYGYDRDLLFLCGHSAGAHLVALLATDPSYLQAHELATKDVHGVMPISGPFDVTAAVGVFTQPFGTDVEVRRDASPQRHITKDAPPFLVLWADKDMAGLPLSGKMFASALRRAEVAVESAEITGRSHGSIIARVGSRDDRTTELVVDFVQRKSARPAAAVTAPSAGGTGR